MTPPKQTVITANEHNDDILGHIVDVLIGFYAHQRIEIDNEQEGYLRYWLGKALADLMDTFLSPICQENARELTGIDDEENVLVHEISQDDWKKYIVLVNRWYAASSRIHERAFLTGLLGKATETPRMSIDDASETWQIDGVTAAPGERIEQLQKLYDADNTKMADLLLKVGIQLGAVLKEKL